MLRVAARVVGALPGALVEGPFGDQAYGELARFLALPEALRAGLIELCEARQVAYVALEAEVLEIYVREEQVSSAHLQTLLPMLVAAARALPSRLPGDARSYSRRHECRHCRCVVFLVATQTECSRCGAPCA